MEDCKTMSQAILRSEVLIGDRGGFIKARSGLIVVLKPIESIPRDGYYNKHLAMLEESPNAEYKIVGIDCIEPKFVDLALVGGSDSVWTRLPAAHVLYVRSK